MDVSLFIKDFEMGAKVSNKLTELDSLFEFSEKSSDVSDSTQLIIVDLDNEETGNELFIHQISVEKNDIKIVGYMKRVQKTHHEKFKMAGCSIILPKSSLVKNLSTFIESK
jgi:hypothetical protein